MFSPQNLLGKKRLLSRCQGQNFPRQSRTMLHFHFLRFAVEEFKPLRSEGRPESCSHVCTKALSAKRVLLLLSEAAAYHEAGVFIKVVFMWLLFLTHKWLPKSHL